MIRVVAAILLVLLACPLFAEKMTQAELDDLFDKWQAEENRTLEGWRVLDDVTLIEKLSPLVEEKADEAGGVLKLTGPREALVLLGIMYRYGVGGAPRDAFLSRKHLHGCGEYFRELVQTYFQVSSDGELNLWSDRTDFQLNGELPSLGGSGAGHAYAAMIFLNCVPRPWLDSSVDEVLKKLEFAALTCLPARVLLARAYYKGTFLRRDVNKATELLQSSALDGYLPALIELARLYHPNNGARPDLGKCREYLHRAANTGCLAAAMQLRELPEVPFAKLSINAAYDRYRKEWGELYEDGAGRVASVLRFKPNRFLVRYDDMAEWLRPIADPTDDIDHTPYEIACARVMLGDCLLHGVGGVEADVEEAVSLLRAAWLTHELAPAALLCGLHLIENPISDVNNESTGMIKSAIDAKFLPALHFQAFASLRWYRLAYSGMSGLDFLELKNAKEVLYVMAEGGDLVALNWAALQSSDIKWKRLGSDAGIPRAMLGYAATISKGGVEGATRDEAVALFRRCLLYEETTLEAGEFLARENAREAEAQARKHEDQLLQTLNETGGYAAFLAGHPYVVGVCQQAYEAGYDHGGVLYALCCAEAHGISRRSSLADEILIGYVDSSVATYIIGRRHEAQGDTRSAIWCYEAAAKVGAGFAAHRLGQIFREGTQKTKDDEKATEWFLTGAEADCQASMIELAKAYRDGVGIEKDFVKAVEWVKKAADLGNEDAKALLDEWNK